MSNVVDERIVAMEFDNSRFQKNAQDTIRALDDLDEKIEDTAKTSSNSLIDLSDGLDRMELIMAGFYNRIGEYIADLGVKFLDMGKNFLKSMSVDQVKEGFGKYTAETLAAQTIMSNASDKIIKQYELTGSAAEKEAKALEITYAALEEVAKYSDETSYSVDRLQDTMSKMVMGGTRLDDAALAVKGIGNWAAVTGAGIEKADAVMPSLVKSFNAGYLRLRDWQTVQANSMGDPVFVEKLIAKSRELNSEMVEWEKKNGKIDYNNFTEAAFGNNKFITAEALIEVLKEYGDETSEIGERGKAAAAEAKTLSEAINAVKDAVSTGWSKSFRHLFGNYQEARTFFTLVQNSLLDIFTLGTDFRNDVLEQWHNLNEGGFNDLLNALSDFWEGLKGLATPIGDAFHEIFGLEDVDKAVQKLGNFVKKFKDFSSKFKRNFTVPRDLEQIALAIRNGDISTVPDELKEKYSDIFEGLDVDSNGVIKNVNQRIKALKKISDVLSDADLQTSKKTLTDIYGTFEGLFSIVDVGKDVIKSFFSIIKNALSKISGLTKPILGFTGSIGGFITSVRDAAKETDLFNRIASSISKVFDAILSPAIEIVSDALGWLSKKVDSVDLHWLTKSFEKLAKFVENVADLISKGLKDAFEWLKKQAGKVKEKLEPLNAVFDDIKDRISNLFKTVSGKEEGKFEDAFNSIGEVLGNIADFLADSVLLPLLDAAVGLFTDLYEATKPLGKSLKSVFDAIKEGFGSLTKSDDSDKESGGILSSVFTSLSEIVKFIVDNAVVPLFEGLAAAIKTLCDETTPLGEIFKNAWKGVKEFFTNLFSGFNLGNIGEEGMSNISRFLGAAGEFIGKAFSWLAGVLADAYNSIKGALEGFKDLGFKDILNIIKEVVSILAGIAGGYSLAGIGSFFMRSGDLVESFNNFVRKITGANKASALIKDIGEALLMFSIAMLVISKIPSEQLGAAADIITDFVDRLGAIVIAMNATSAYFTVNVGPNIRGVNLFASNMVDLALGVLLVAFALKKLADADLSEEKIKAPLDAIKLFIEEIASMEILLTLASKNYSFASGTTISGGAAKASGIIGFAIGIWLISKALIDVANKADVNKIEKAAEVIKGIILALGVVLATVSLLKGGGNKLTVRFNTSLLQMAVLIAAIGAVVLAVNKYVTDERKIIAAGEAIGIMAVVLVALSQLASHTNIPATNIAGIYAMVGVIAALTAVIYLLGKIDTSNALGNAALVAAALYGILNAVKFMAAPIETLSNVLFRFAEAVALIGAGALMLAAAFKIIVSAIDDTNKEINENTIKNMDKIKNYLGAALSVVFDMITAFLAALLGSAATMLATLINTLADHAEEMIDAVVNLIANVAAAIKKNKTKIGKAVADLLKSIWDAFKSFVRELFGVASHALDTIDDSFHSLTGTADLLTSAVLGVVAAFATWKTLNPIINFIETFGSKVKYMYGLLADSTALTVLGIGAAIIGVTATVISAVSNYEDRLRVMGSGVAEHCAAIDELTSKINENYDAVQKRDEQRSNSIAENNSELQYYRDLADELSTIVDENGNVQKGYEDRAKFITDTLSKALGIEIDNTGKVIKNYDKISESIDNVIEKKKGELLLSLDEEDWTNAYKNRTQASLDLKEVETKRVENQELLNKKQKELEDLRSAALKAYLDDCQKYGEEYANKQDYIDLTLERQLSTEVLNLQKRNKELDDAYAEASYLVEKYAYDIEKYEHNAELAAKGHYDEMVTLNFDTAKTYSDMKDDSISALSELEKKQIESAAIISNKAKETVDAVKESAENMAKVPDKTKADAEKNYTDLGMNIPKGLAKGIQDGKSIKLVQKAMSTLDSAITKTISIDFDMHSPSMLFYKYGSYIDEGLANGINAYSYYATDATENLAYSLTAPMQDAISEIADLNLSSVGDPVIRPVLDLSEIQNGARNLGSFFGSGYSVGLSASGVGSMSGYGASPIFNFTINAADGQSEEAIATAVMNRINAELRSRGNIWKR